MLERKIRLSSRNKCRRFLTKDVVLQHAPYALIRFNRHVLSLRMWVAVLLRPAYSRNLAPSDFHLLGALEDGSRGKAFSNKEVRQKRGIIFDGDSAEK